MTVLLEIPEGQKVRILAIAGGISVRQHLSGLGVHHGDTVIIKKQSRWGGPILIEVHGSEVALGRGIAAKIRVVET
jgi:ferrous iron transport protein A